MTRVENPTYKNRCCEWLTSTSKTQIKLSGEWYEYYGNFTSSLYSPSSSLSPTLNMGVSVDSSTFSFPFLRPTASSSSRIEVGFKGMLSSSMFGTAVNCDLRRLNRHHRNTPIPRNISRRTSALSQHCNTLLFWNIILNDEQGKKKRKPTYLPTLLYPAEVFSR